MIGSYFILKKKLSGDYLDRFNYVERFGNRLQISQEIMAEKMMDLIDLMLQAQESGTPVEKITGKNTDEFCSNYFSDIPVTDLLKNPFRSFKSIVWLTLGMSVICLLDSSEKDTLLNYKDDHIISGVLAGLYIPIIIGFITDIITLITKSYSDQKKAGKIHVSGLILSFLFIIVFTTIAVKNELTIPFPAHEALTVSGLFLIISSSVKLIIRYRTTGSLKKNTNDYLMPFAKVVEAQSEKQAPQFNKNVIKAYAKRYKKAARKYRKKKGERLTTEMHFKDLNRKNVILITLSSLTGLIIGIGLFNFIIRPDFSAPEDKIYFYLILAVLFIGFLILMLTSTRQVKNIMDKILAECRKENVELDRYYKILLKKEHEH